MDRIALIIDGDTPVNAVVVAEGKSGDDWLTANPNAVEVTGLDPMPGVGTGWTYDGEWVAPVPPVPIREEVEQARQVAYQQTADPIFFQYQRGDATEQEWLNAVQAVKDAHPYPEDVTTNETE
jgi:hypothetical protein